MITVGKYPDNVIQAINEGKEIIKEAGGVAFLNPQEAIDWGNHHLGAGEFKLYELCDCTEDSFVEDSKPKYPTKKKLIKPLKLMPYVG